MDIFSFVKLPFTDAVGVFTTLFFVILFLPPLFKKLKIPGIIGLIIAGILVGPHGINLLSKEIGFNILGSFGLLYLMYLVGLEINLQDFLQHRKKALSFGLLSYFIPFVLGSILCLAFFKLDILVTIAIATMLGTHTLVAYPIVGKYGLKNQLPVTLVIGATIIADTLALIFVSLISELSHGNVSAILLIGITIRYAILFIFTLVILPYLCKWFFTHYEGETTYEFIFTIAMAMASAFLAELVHIEPIIGTFFAGLAMNRHIPRSSPLMNKITFIGESLFIPLFLISVGILINPGSFTASWSVWGLVIVLFSAYVGGKYLASFIISKNMNFSSGQRNLIAGLSSAKAAAAIAVAIIIFKAGLMDETIINITVLLILFTSIYSSFLTDYSSRKIVFESVHKPGNINGKSDRVLVPVSNPLTMKYLIRFALFIKEKNNTDPLHILTVSNNTKDAIKAKNINESVLREELDFASENNIRTKFVSRIDLNISEGISDSVSDLKIDKIVIGWNIQKTALNYFFGDVLQNLLNKTNKMVMVVKLHEDISTNNRVVSILPPNFEYEKNFSKCLNSITSIATGLNTALVILCHKSSLDVIENEILEFKKKVSLQTIFYHEYTTIRNLKFKINNDDLIIPVKARKHSISYNKVMDEFPYELSDNFTENNCLLLYPEQEPQIFTGTLHI